MAVILCFQTKLHDGVCQKRQAATIATHDLKSVKLPLKYDAQFPQVLQVSRTQYKLTEIQNYVVEALF